MSAHHNTITPNPAFTGLRAALPSPVHAGQQMSRGELAEIVSGALDKLYPVYPNRSALHVDARWVGRLERGEILQSGKERRAALRKVLGVATDTDLGLRSARSVPASPPQPPVS